MSFFLRLVCTCEETCEPFGHTTQVPTQVQLASTCDYSPVRLAKALEIAHNFAEGQWNLTMGSREGKTISEIVFIEFIQ